MKRMTKKRFKGYLIDLAISTAVTAGVENFLRKKVKNEAVHAIVTPAVVMWALEYVQLRQFGQAAGYKASGIPVTDEGGTSLTSGQIVKRMAYTYRRHRELVAFEEKLAIIESFSELQRHDISLGRANFQFEKSVMDK